MEFILEKRLKNLKNDLKNICCTKNPNYNKIISNINKTHRELYIEKYKDKYKKNLFIKLNEQIITHDELFNLDFIKLNKDQITYLYGTSLLYKNTIATAQINMYVRLNNIKLDKYDIYLGIHKADEHKKNMEGTISYYYNTCEPVLYNINKQYCHLIDDPDEEDKLFKRRKNIC
jgi:hypothetical protein